LAAPEKSLKLRGQKWIKEERKVANLGTNRFQGRERGRNIWLCPN